MKKILLSISILLIGLSIQLQAQDYLFPAKNYAFWGYINSQGEWVMEPEFRDAKEFTEGLAAVKVSNGWGFINRNGDWIIAPQFENAIPFSEGLAAVVQENQWGFIDHAGNFIIDHQFQKVSSFSEGLALVSNGDGFIFISQEGDLIGESFEFALPFAEGMAPFRSYDQQGGGYIDNNGVITIKHSFSKAAPFSEGLAQVSSNNKWGFIDRSGNVSIPLVFESSGHFSNGLAAVRKEGKWGYINKKGEWIIDADYEFAKPFVHGIAVVKHKDEYGTINPEGEWILKPKFQEIRNVGKAVSLKEQLKSMIQDRFAEWSTKGEFEKTKTYTIRMEDKNKRKAMESISQEVINTYGSWVIDLQKAELGYYNADLEQFNIYIPGALPTMIQVPLEEALWFKENYRNGHFMETDFLLAGESLIISNYKFNLHGESYTFDISDTEGFLYNYATIAWEEEIMVPEVSWEVNAESGNSLIAKAGTSDVDRNIPVREPHNKNTFALIIGNEDYKSFQSGLTNEIDVSFATTDAEIFSRYTNLTLGVPEENITLITNGTAGQINQALAKMSSIADAYKGEAEFIFYYAGHGLPDEATGKPYLIPVDVNGTDLSFAISLDEALNKLTENPHTRVTVFLDACFTGGGRNEGIIASRGVKIKPKSPFVKGNLILFSASSGTQSAFAYYEKAHGIFTYYLLKKLQDSNGAVTYLELDQYLKENVRKSAIVYNSKEQDPELMISPSFEDSWKGLRLDIPSKLSTDSRTLKP